MQDKDSAPNGSDADNPKKILLLIAVIDYFLVKQEKGFWGLRLCGVSAEWACDIPEELLSPADNGFKE